MELGIVPREKRKSAKACLAAGQARVNGPVFAIMALGYGGIVALPFFFRGTPMADKLVPADAPSPLAAAAIAFLTLAAIVLPAGFAWIWWSFQVPRWRIWALQNVDDWRALEKLAVLTGLIWPRGWIFEKTEIKTAGQRALERELLRARNGDG